MGHMVTGEDAKGKRDGGRGENWRGGIEREKKYAIQLLSRGLHGAGALCGQRVGAAGDGGYGRLKPPPRILPQTFKNSCNFANNVWLLAITAARRGISVNTPRRAVQPKNAIHAPPHHTHPGEKRGCHACGHGCCQSACQQTHNRGSFSLYVVTPVNLLKWSCQRGKSPVQQLSSDGTLEAGMTEGYFSVTLARQRGGGRCPKCLSPPEGFRSVKGHRVLIEAEVQ